MELVLLGERVNRDTDKYSRWVFNRSSNIIRRSHCGYRKNVKKYGSVGDHNL